MMPPEYLDEAVEEVLQGYQALNELMIKDLAKELATFDRGMDVEVWKIQRLSQSPMIYERMVKRIVRLTPLTEEAIRNSLTRAGFLSAKLDLGIYEMAGRGLEYSIETSPAILQLMEAQIIKTQGVLNNLTMTTANTTQAQFIASVTNAAMQVETGALPYTKAIREAIKSLPLGMSKVLYSSGHSDHLDVATRRAIVTSVGQTASRVSLKLMEELECDLVEVSAHGASRPEHAEWQGKVFTRGGRHKKYKDFEKETGFGTGAGLCGWNCRHTFFPYFEGISTKAYTDKQLRAYERDTLSVGGKQITQYEARQVQRSIERDIRSAKRSQAAFTGALEGAKDPELLKELREGENESKRDKLDAQKRMREFIKETGLYRRSDRESVKG